MTRRAGVDRFFDRFARAPKAELHLHLEGSVSAATLVRLSRRVPDPVFPDAASFRRRLHFAGPGEFLALYRDVCRQLRGPEDYAAVARDLVRRLRRERIAHAEVYVSPAIVERMGLSWPAVQRALEEVFSDHERRGGGTVTVLVDSVRQWGPGAAHRVLDLFARHAWPRVLGFGLGGDENALPAREFAGVYRRVRDLGLAPLVHAGEWSGPGAVAEALELLRPVRIAHGFRAAEDAALVRRLARAGVALDICLTSNAATRALAPGARHPIRELLRAGVRVTLSTDDPGLFGTTLRGEYRRLARLGASGRELAAVLAFSRGAALSGFRRPGPAHTAPGTSRRSSRR